MTPEERAEFVQDVAAAIKVSEPVLSADEQQWVRLAIQKEAQSIKLRQAIIEKTLAGLVWAGLIGLALIFKEFATSHGWKP
jgi:hypothetical protein